MNQETSGAGGDVDNSCPKVFGIGFHKTGTTSLAVALQRLGYTVTGPNGVHNPDIATTAWPMAKELIDQFDAFQDNPWPVLFEELYSYRPESKFVLTRRDPNKWIRSVVKHFGTDTTPMRQWIYGVGSPAGNERLYLERFDRHYSDVVDFFSDKPGSLLVMDITAGDGWGKLCPFLARPAPDGPFPRENARRALNLARLRSMMRHIR